MTTLPTAVALTTDQVKRFAAITDKQTAVQGWLKQITDQAERRLEELAGQSRELWQELQAEHKLDLEHVAYSLDETGQKIVPRQVRFT